jgi:hypothetical protein
MEGVPGSMHTQTRPRPESASMAEVEGALDDVGFAFAPAAALQQALGAVDPEEWEDFARSWNDLGDDRYMADGGRYRRRRFAAFNGSAQGFERKPHQPHYQSREFNPLNGGIDRWFEPVHVVTAILRLDPSRHAFRDVLIITFSRVERHSWHA